ncbi:44705_t:CDS:2 [Gigaspora margarita]|uniref:44705_t:CDS:1 n=1 Tax=Gigaspora margarita TaxID=4874 RepID=A0ABN7VDP1_GIGMA|nr:44705_t:CDS:2 [Gigaspora margarita]
MLLEEALSNNLELLLNSLDLIPEHITEFLSFALPITDCKQTRAVVANIAIKEAANKYIPTNKAVPKPFHAFSFKATKLHQALKLSNKARRLIMFPPLTKSTQTIADKVYTILQQIEQLTNYQIPNITQQDL